MQPCRAITEMTCNFFGIIVEKKKPSSKEAGYGMHVQKFTENTLFR